MQMATRLVCSVIVRVRAVLKRTVAGDSHFDNLSQINSVCQLMVL